MDAPRVIYGMPDHEYHAVPAFSASAAKRILEAPAKFKEFLDFPEPPSPSMAFGTLVHTLVLEPDSVVDRYVVARDWGRSKDDVAAKAAWLTECRERRLTIVSEEDWDRAHKAAASVLAHPSASKLLDRCVREVSIFWHDSEFNIPCKARLDAWDRDRRIVCDLKTSRDASPEGFGRAAWNFGYATQAAHYSDAAEIAYGDGPLAAFVFIAVETERPHLCAAYRVNPTELAIGASQLRAAKAAYADAMETGVWVGYSDFVQPLILPGWAYRSEE